MPSINNFFLSRFKESNETLRGRPQPTHREEVPGGGRLNYHSPCRWMGERLRHGGVLSF
jgi:hypothetical protein